MESRHISPMAGFFTPLGSVINESGVAGNIPLNKASSQGWLLI